MLREFGMDAMGSLTKLLLCAGGFLGGGAIGSGITFATGVSSLPAIFGIIGLVVAIWWVKDR